MLIYPSNTALLDLGGTEITRAQQGTHLIPSILSTLSQDGFDLDNLHGQDVGRPNNDPTAS